MRLRLTLLTAALFLSGCVSTTPWSIAKPGTWPIFSHAKAQNAAAAAGAKGVAQEDLVVTAAHIELVKTDSFLAAFAAKNPTNLEIGLAQRTSTNALALLNQRRPLPAVTMAETLKVSRELLAGTDLGEKAQQKAEAGNSKLSKDLEATREKIKALEADAKEAAVKNAALADELTNERFMKWAGVGLSTILGIAAFAYRLNLGNFQAGTVDMLAKLRANHGDAAAGAATSALDAALSRAQQQSVAQALFKLTKA